MALGKSLLPFWQSLFLFAVFAPLREVIFVLEIRFIVSTSPWADAYRAVTLQKVEICPDRVGRSWMML